MMSNADCRVFWTKTAQHELRAITKYISADNKAVAADTYRKIKQRAELLTQMPDQGRSVPELSSFGVLIYREMIVSPWRIIYKVEGGTVWVLAVFDGRRNIEDILLDRMLR